jgi:glucose/mannose-6-phosphate isomerase
LLDFPTLNKYDTEKMYKIYDKWAIIARDSYYSDLKPVNFENIHHIVFAGMGGSGTIGDLLSSILSNSNIHVSVVKGYVLPKTVDENTLVVTTSISGNSVETLTILDSALKLNSKIIGFSSGGKMKSYCTENKIPFREIKELHSPRASFIIFTFSILKVLNSILPIEKSAIDESLVELENLSKQISSSNLNHTNPALELAKKISGFPVIYYPAGLQSAAIRFKNSLQENAKIHTIVEDVIEMCHNGIVPWEQKSSSMPILIQGKDDFIKTKERWKILKEFFKEKNIQYEDIFSIEGNILSKLVCLIYLLDFTSLYKAVLSQINPTTVYPINFVKERLKQ